MELVDKKWRRAILSSYRLDEILDLSKFGVPPEQCESAEQSIVPVRGGGGQSLCYSKWGQRSRKTDTP